MCIFNAVKIQSGIGFIVDALFGNFAFLHNLYTVVELHTNFVLIHFGSQSITYTHSLIYIHGNCYVYAIFALTIL